jgi:hypothetical protein
MIAMCPRAEKDLKYAINIALTTEFVIPAGDARRRGRSAHPVDYRGRGSRSTTSGGCTRWLATSSATRSNSLAADSVRIRTGQDGPGDAPHPWPCPAPERLHIAAMATAHRLRGRRL